MSEETKPEQIPTEEEEKTEEKTEEPPAKKQKVIDEGYTMNINLAVDKGFETKSLTEISESPVACLQGISDRGGEILEKYKVKTVADLANWKFARWCEAIDDLADQEEDGCRAEGSMMNLNKALDKEYETKPLKEIKDAPLASVQGLSDAAVEYLDSLTPKVDTISKLGNWKYYKWAKSITTLAAVENADFSSR
mmetsp:Transcript_19124/g.24116  ORF Transcript_19124/g.24116 Transcript_19124/m.24116 type:complete len:194 (-) Transcript_19124:514-1095(-)